MKRFNFAAIAVMAMACAMLALAGCASGPRGDAQGASDEPSKTKQLIIGFDAEYPPFGFKAEDGSYIGFDIDLAAAVAEANGWDFEAKPIVWDERDSELESGNITCIWNGFTMEGREGQYAFSEPYMINEQVVVTKSHSGIETLEDLAGKKVVTQTTSAAFEILAGPQAELTATFDGGAPLMATDYADAFLQLDSGAADAVACDLSYAAYQMSQSGDKYFKIDEPLSVEHYGVGFKLGDEETAKVVTNTLKVLYESGTVEELCKKYEEYGLSFTSWILR